MFFGADHGEEEVEFRGRRSSRSISSSAAACRARRRCRREPLLAYALNGEPLTKHQGSPLRLLVPGWYGVANVKWLSQIHAQEEQYLGKYQARWYRTLRGEMIDGEMKWKETAITHMQLKSFIARVTQGRQPAQSARRRAERRHADQVASRSRWTRARGSRRRSIRRRKDKYSWKLFTYAWNGATPGEHTLVSRVTDVNGKVQPTAAGPENKKSFLEDNSQHPRKVMIAVEVALLPSGRPYGGRFLLTSATIAPTWPSSLRFLCAVDHSTLAPRVLRHAVGLAAAFGAKLTVLSGTDRRHYVEGRGLATADPGATPFRWGALRRRTAIPRDPCGPGATPADALLECVEPGTDLLVGGTHARSGPSRWVPGLEQRRAAQARALPDPAHSAGRHRHRAPRRRPRRASDTGTVLVAVHAARITPVKLAVASGMGLGPDPPGAAPHRPAPATAGRRPSGPWRSPGRSLAPLTVHEMVVPQGEHVGTQIAGVAVAQRARPGGDGQSRSTHGALPAQTGLRDPADEVGGGAGRARRLGVPDGGGWLRR